jgi:hypothetical protein
MTISIPASDAGTVETQGQKKTVLDPTIGKQCSAPQSSIHHPRIANDGSVVAVWTNFVDPKREEDLTQRYFFAKRVSDDKELQKTLFEWPIGEKDQYCPDAGSLYYQCSDSVVRERKALVNNFLAAYRWNDMNCYVMRRMDDFCATPQKLLFSDMDIRFNDLVLRIAKPSGEVLLERKLPPWNVYPHLQASDDPQYFGNPDHFEVDFIAIDFGSQTMLVALTYCEPGISVDANLRFHVLQFPPI